MYVNCIHVTPFLFAADESGSDEDFMVEDDDDSDYGHSKKRSSKKVIRRGRPEKKEKKSPKPRLKATGEASSYCVATASDLLFFFSSSYIS